MYKIYAHVTCDIGQIVTKEIKSQQSSEEPWRSSLLVSSGRMWEASSGTRTSRFRRENAMAVDPKARWMMWMGVAPSNWMSIPNEYWCLSVRGVYYISIYLYIYNHVYIYIYVYIYMYMYIYICIYVYIYMYIYIGWLGKLGIIIHDLGNLIKSCIWTLGWTSSDDHSIRTSQNYEAFGSQWTMGMIWDHQSSWSMAGENYAFVADLHRMYGDVSPPCPWQIEPAVASYMHLSRQNPDLGKPALPW